MRSRDDDLVFLVRRKDDCPRKVSDDLPTFDRVRKVRCDVSTGTWTIECECPYFKNWGLPCRHMLAVNKGKVLMHHIAIRWYIEYATRSPIPEEWLNANTFQPPSLEQEIDEYDVVFDDLWYRNHIPHADDVSTSTEGHQEENTPQMQQPEEKKDETPEQNRNQRAMYWDIRNAFEELQGLSAHFQSSPDHAQWMVTKLHEWIHITRSYMEQQNVHDLPTSGIVDPPALPHQGPPPDRQKPMWEIVVSNGVFVSAPVPSDSLRETPAKRPRGRPAHVHETDDL